jgi:diguanylate cyclase (GGDEF)-like protein
MHTVLIVDDSQIELIIGKALLTKMGYTVLTASGGQEALRVILENTPDIVISDVNMPGMNGLELLASASHITPPPIFIMATALGDVESAVTAIEQGAYGYLVKPLKEDLLARTIHEAVIKHENIHKAHEEIARLAKTDPITGLLNKDAFIEMLDKHLHSMRKNDRLSALIFLNVDGLRYINNTYGHHEGDQVLQHIAEILRNSTRSNDALSRFGGDIFGVALTSISDENIAIKAQTILNNIEQSKFLISSNEHGVTATMGVALCKQDINMEDLINNADFALMIAKKQGCNRFYIYHQQDESYRRDFDSKLNNLNILKRAIDQANFEMHYQPIVSLDSGIASHYEALIRMHDEDGKLLPPDIFIKTAEAFGLINKIDHMVVKACFNKLSELPAAQNISLAINLSGKSVGDDKLLELIEHEISLKKFPASRVIFEITETAAFYDVEAVQQFVSRIKKLGCKFALDDFGVGFSSFYYIKKLDIDYLKIDGSFIQHLQDNKNDQVFVQAMVEISRVFEMQVIAEWVEDKSTESLLKQLGVNYGQGYYFGKPAAKL